MIRTHEGSKSLSQKRVLANGPAQAMETPHPHYKNSEALKHIFGKGHHRHHTGTE